MQAEGSLAHMSQMHDTQKPVTGPGAQPDACAPRTYLPDMVLSAFHAFPSCLVQGAAGAYKQFWEDVVHVLISN